MLDNGKAFRTLLRGSHSPCAPSLLIGCDVLARCSLAPLTCGPASGHVASSGSLAARRAGGAQRCVGVAHLIAYHERLIRGSTTNEDGERERERERERRKRKRADGRLYIVDSRQ